MNKLIHEEVKVSLKNEKERLSDRINFHHRLISMLNREVESMILTVEAIEKAIEIKYEHLNVSND